MKITKKHIDKSLKARPNKYLKKVKGVVIHYTANENKGADANAHYRYINNNPKIAAFAHYFVDSKNGIVEMIPSNELAYHVGSKTYTTTGKKLMEGGYSPNNFLIGIEMCVNKDGNFTKTYDYTVMLAKHLLNLYGLDESNLYRHYDITRKNCPAMLINEKKWSKFKNNVANYKEAKEDIDTDIIDNFEVMITCNKLNIREYPVSSAKVISQYKRGELVRVNNMENGWYETPLGWISSAYTEDAQGDDEDLEPESSLNGRVTTKSLNVRELPTTDSNIVSKLRYNDKIIIFDHKNSWYLTHNGWVHGSYIKIEEV